MRKINLKGISEILSEKELKNVMGGCTLDCGANCSGSCIIGGFTTSCKLKLSGNCVCAFD